MQDITAMKLSVDAWDYSFLKVRITCSGKDCKPVISG